MASTDLERGLVGFLVWTLVQFYMVLYSPIHFAHWFKTGHLNVDVYGLAIQWQVQTLERRFVEFLVWALVWCNLTLSYMASSILPADSNQVFFMCIFVDWQFDGKYILVKKIGWVPCVDPDVVQFDIVLSSLIHFACQLIFMTSVLNVYVCGLAGWWQYALRQKIGWVLCHDPGVV